MTWRTAHLVVSGAAFAVWLTACVALYVLCDMSSGLNWWILVPAAVMPPFWCVYAWVASRRADPNTARVLMILAVPVLLSGLSMAAVVAGDVVKRSGSWLDSRPPSGLDMVGECGWPIAALCGLISFVWAVALQVKSHFQPPEEP